MCLDLVSLSGTYQSWKDAFGTAKQRWESIINGDMTGTVSSSGLNSTFACTNYPLRIDDLYICGQEAVIDGLGGILGSTVLIYARGAGAVNPLTGREYLVALAGQMIFDTDDLNLLVRTGKLDSVVLHEMGHALGIGTLWDFNGLYSQGSGVYNPGTSADREWKAIGCSGPLPVELDRGIGSANVHWDEECLRYELMTGGTDLSSNREPLSRITIGSLKDMGYKVDFNQADPFTIDDLRQCGSFCPGAGGRRRETNEPRAQEILGNEEMMNTIMSYAKIQMIEMQRALVEANGHSNDGIKAAEEIFVLYEAEGKIYDFHVTWAEVKDFDI